MKQSLSIYLHIPFCSTKCTYCAFNTYVNLESLIEPFTFALTQEIAAVGKNNPGSPVGTIFFGGGTPSLLSPAQFETILSALKRHFTLLDDLELSIEANPGDLTFEYLKSLRNLGVNRLSIGMQSAVARELQLFDRRHDNDAVVHSVSLARRAGFNNLNLDLIYGVPHQSLADWKTTLQQALILQPDHISLYALGLEDGTAMKSWVSRGYLPSPDDDLAADMYDLATELLGEAGYEQYEISNWSKPGYQCKHNLQYWHNLPYVGLGPGAHGFAGGYRYAVMLSPHKYIQAMQRETPDMAFPLTAAVDQSVEVTREAEIAETLMMGLRLTQEGIRRPVFQERFGIDVMDLHGAVLARYIEHGLLYVDADCLRLTQQGRLLSNMIFRELV